MEHSIVRYDLDKCYRFKEYNEASTYAKRNIEIKGVKEQYQKLIAEKDNYVQERLLQIEEDREMRYRR